MSHPYQSIPNYYKLLGVARDATTEEIAQAYTAIVERVDKPLTQAAQELLADAFETLSDPETRAEYDEELPAGIYYYEETRIAPLGLTRPRELASDGLPLLPEGGYFDESSSIKDGTVVLGGPVSGDSFDFLPPAAAAPRQNERPIREDYFPPVQKIAANGDLLTTLNNIKPLRAVLHRPELRSIFSDLAKFGSKSRSFGDGKIERRPSKRLAGVFAEKSYLSPVSDLIRSHSSPWDEIMIAVGLWSPIVTLVSALIYLALR